MKKLTIDQLNALKFTVTVEITDFEENTVEGIEEYDHESGKNLKSPDRPYNWGVGRVTMSADADGETIELSFYFEFSDIGCAMEDAGDFDISLNNHGEHDAEFTGFVVVDEDEEGDELDEDGVISELDKSHWIHDAYRSLPELSKAA